MRAVLPDTRKNSEQTLTKALTISLVVAAGVASLVLWASGLLPDSAIPRGFGTPLADKPYFAQSPPLLFSPAPQADDDSTSQSSVIRADKAFVPNQKQQAALVSVKSYLRALERTEAAKQALLQEMVARFPQLRVALVQTRDDSAHAQFPETEALRAQSASVQEQGDLAQDAWNQIFSDFEQQMPPSACIELHADYRAHLKTLRDYVTLCLGNGEKSFPDQERPGKDPAEEREQAKSRLNTETNVAGEALNEVYARYGLKPGVEILIITR